jgi:transposase
MLVPKLKKRQIVIMDNASIHKKKEIRKVIEKVGRHLVSLPPDLNPIEYFWSWLKRKIRSLKLKFDSLADAIQYVLL